MLCRTTSKNDRPIPRNRSQLVVQNYLTVPGLKAQWLVNYVAVAGERLFHHTGIAEFWDKTGLKISLNRVCTDAGYIWQGTSGSAF
jgi:hypothetical protein